MAKKKTAAKQPSEAEHDIEALSASLRRLIGRVDAMEANADVIGGALARTMGTIIERFADHQKDTASRFANISTWAGKKAAVIDLLTSTADKHQAKLAGLHKTAERGFALIKRLRETSRRPSPAPLLLMLTVMALAIGGLAGWTVGVNIGSGRQDARHAAACAGDARFEAAGLAFACAPGR